MGLFRFAYSLITSFCLIPLLTEAKPIPKGRDEPSTFLGKLGILETQGLLGTNIASAKMDNNGNMDRNIVKAIEGSLTGPDSISKTVKDADLPLTKDDKETAETDKGLVEDNYDSDYEEEPKPNPGEYIPQDANKAKRLGGSKHPKNKKNKKGVKIGVESP